ncbi:hypothetical protein [Chryseolinea lacunae]|uniref:Type II toxin-antitoxin system HicB family antitoxin n=1 Tax=Chryseolinea lacunae TaxID=2801331 RepID=A0ABS1KKB8_9BACT|nr:hypothetical protein [Chryseolinea lacunae]MBL0739793.1 hypothetical protein [Chryseolinea lacunae]
MNTLNEYKGYVSTIDYSQADRVFYGKLSGISDTVAFEGCTIDELGTAFRFAVDDYIKTCQEIGKAPE